MFSSRRSILKIKLINKRVCINILFLFRCWIPEIHLYVPTSDTDKTHLFDCFIWFGWAGGSGRVEPSRIEEFDPPPTPSQGPWISQSDPSGRVANAFHDRSDIRIYNVLSTLGHPANQGSTTEKYYFSGNKDICAESTWLRPYVFQCYDHLVTFGALLLHCENV